jgi:hypothetical protein
MKCIFCADTGWVCENHLRRPWEGPHGCDCGGAGMPCAACNVPEEDVAPRMPDGFKTEVDGWRHCSSFPPGQVPMNIAVTA